MAISFKCGGCAKQYSVKDELAGKRAQCKNCGQVMQIPNLAASTEPDLHAEGREGGGASANAETVAGSLISTPFESLSGRGASASGRSVSGRNASGNSAAGSSVSGSSAAGQSSAGRQQYSSEPAYTPPADPDYGQPQLQAMKHVGQSDQDAFDVDGGTEQVLSQERGPAARNRAPGEPYSFLLVLLMLGALAYSAYAYANATPLPAGVPADVFAKAGKPVMAGAFSRATTFVVALAVIAPLIMLSWFAACKIANVRLPSNLYLRSLGLASLAVAAMAVVESVPAAANLAPVLGLLAIGLGYGMLHFIHLQHPIVGGITAGIAALLATVGLLVADSASVAVQTSLRADYDKKAEKVRVDYLAAEKKKKEDALLAKIKNDAQTQAVAIDTATDDAVKQLTAKVEAFKTGLSNKQQTREKLALAADAILAALAENKEKSPSRPEWDTLTADLQAARLQAEAFPSAQPSLELTEAPPAGADWSTRPGRREVSVFAFNITPPLEGLIDLDAPAGAMQWTIGESHVKLTIEPVAGNLPKQERPWVVPAFVIAASNNAAVAVPADSTARVEYGVINGLSAAKITADAASASDSKLFYTLHQGDTWLRCTISPAASGDLAVQAAQQSVRSIRLRAANEPVADPMPAADLIARFQADPTTEDRVVAMLRNKPNAEEAVLKAMGFAPEESTVEKFGPLLVATATAKSSGPLWKLAAAGTPLGDAARDRLRAVEPANADDLAFGLLDVRSGLAAQVKKGLAVLAFSETSAARQPAVSKALQTAIDNNAVFAGGTTDAQEAVLTKWFDDDIGKKLQTFLEKGNSNPAHRKVAIRTLGATRQKKYAPVICRWILDDTATVQQTLVGMGSLAAEADVAKLLGNDSTPVARKAALEILDEIGTVRSFPALQAAAMRSDPETSEHAKAVIVRIREKAKAAAPPVVPPAVPPVQPR